jgi:hypothetical protein
MCVFQTSPDSLYGPLVLTGVFVVIYIVAGFKFVAAVPMVRTENVHSISPDFKTTRPILEGIQRVRALPTLLKPRAALPSLRLNTPHPHRHHRPHRGHCGRILVRHLAHHARLLVHAHLDLLLFCRRGHLQGGVHAVL